MNQIGQDAGARTVGVFEGYVDGEPLVTWCDRTKMPRVGDKIFALRQTQVETKASGDAGAAQTCRSSAKVQVMQECGIDTFVGQPFAIVQGYRMDSDRAALACFTGSEYEFSDGDRYHRKGDTLAGFPAEFVTLNQLEQRLLDVAPAQGGATLATAPPQSDAIDAPQSRQSESSTGAIDTLSTMLWLYRRLPRCYGRQTHIEVVIERLARHAGIDVTQDLAERGPDPQTKNENEGMEGSNAN